MGRGPATAETGDAFGRRTERSGFRCRRGYGVRRATSGDSAGRGFLERGRPPGASRRRFPFRGDSGTCDPGTGARTAGEPVLKPLRTRAETPDESGGRIAMNAATDVVREGELL